MFNMGDILWQLFYVALLVLFVKAVRFFIKHMTKMINLESKRDELYDRLKKGNGVGQLYQMDVHKILGSKE
ncbi:hypothetical protein ABG775_20045 [Peribacillus simplex]|uniref:hypothetical protein n=1 Tax=Peribacillus TaxID=2675229 RepID=UPI00177BFC1A|nr:hypothetical protein [Brevibacillus sp. JNUCC-41]QOS90550.1 hypothetical protein JNUCC41_01845 [Brevibacillus sp. JNUCC-41]